jgi:hypothetical protein
MKKIIIAFTALVLLSAMNIPKVAAQVTAKKPPQSKTGQIVRLTVMNPQGPVKKVKDLAPRPRTLDGKKIALWLSSTADQFYAGKGAALYDALTQMLKDSYPGIQIVPYTSLPMKFMPENEVIGAIVSAKPDGVVIGFGG